MVKEAGRMPEKPPHYESYSSYEAADIIIQTEAKKGLRPALESFADIAGEEEIRAKEQILRSVLERIQRDEKRLDPVEKRKRFEQKKISDAFEVTVTVQGYESEWLGSNVFVTRATEYDDVVNGVDAVAEFNAPHEGRETPRLALAIDATTDQNYTTIERKIKNNIEKILAVRGKSAQVEYFESEITDERGRIEHIVPIVLGLEHAHAKELLVEHANLITLQTLQELGRDSYKEEIRRIRERLATHPAQKLFIKEIQTQLDLYQNILESRTDPQSEAYKEKISDLKGVFANIAGEKAYISLGDIADDAVYELIEDTPSKLEKDYS